MLCMICMILMYATAEINDFGKKPAWFHRQDIAR